jgi:hypothetical protein
VSKKAGSHQGSSDLSSPEEALQVAGGRKSGGLAGWLCGALSLLAPPGVSDGQGLQVGEPERGRRGGRSVQGQIQGSSSPTILGFRPGSRTCSDDGEGAQGLFGSLMRLVVEQATAEGLPG